MSRCIFIWNNYFSVEQMKFFKFRSDANSRNKKNCIMKNKSLKGVGLFYS